MAPTKKNPAGSSGPRRVARRRAAGEAAPTPPLPESAEVSKATAKSPARVTPEERHRMIAEAAYYLALKKGAHSDPRSNWLEAEAQIDAQLRAEGRL